RLYRGIGGEERGDLGQLRAVVRHHLVEEQQVGLELLKEPPAPPPTLVLGQRQRVIADAVQRGEMVLKRVVLPDVAPGAARDRALFRRERRRRGRRGRGRRGHDRQVPLVVHDA